jgi:hypothetical protein
VSSDILVTVDIFDDCLGICESSAEAGAEGFDECDFVVIAVRSVDFLIIAEEVGNILGVQTVVICDIDVKGGDWFVDCDCRFQVNSYPLESVLQSMYSL